MPSACSAYQILHAAQRGWERSLYKLSDNCDCQQAFCMSSSYQLVISCNDTDNETNIRKLHVCE